MDNAAIASQLEEWADILDIEGANRFKSRAYRRASDVVAHHPRSVAGMVQERADLQQIEGIGEGLAHRIQQIVEGTWTELEEGRKKHGLTGDYRQLAAQLRGDLHAHTVATDGRATIQQMAEAARARGYEYLAITDHSKDTSVAGGLNERQMRRHLDDVRRVSEQMDGITLLAGSEVDILKDGSLDFPDDLLGDMDVVVCSVHYRHRLDGEAQTQRILAGMSNEHADILGHPTGRRKGLRPGMEIDMERLVEAARDQGWAMEMNGAPERLDLDALAAQAAHEAGVLVSLDSDAHSVGELGNIRNACRLASGAGIEEQGILNAQPLKRLQKLLR